MGLARYKKEVMIMPDWYVPQIIIDDEGQMSVDVQVDDNISVDMTDTEDPDEVEYVRDNVTMTISGNDVETITMSPEAFRGLIEGEKDISGNDITLDQEDSLIEPDMALYDGVMPVDVAGGSFNPQQWQINIAQNRPIGWHYVMSRRSSGNNDYFVVIGKDITYSGGVYRYAACDYYRLYSYNSGGTIRYEYSFDEAVSGTVASSDYVVYSDLYFDYFGSRVVMYSCFMIGFFIVFLLVLIWWKWGVNKYHD